MKSDEAPRGLVNMNCLIRAVMDGKKNLTEQLPLTTFAASQNGKDIRQIIFTGRFIAPIQMPVRKTSILGLIYTLEPDT